MGVSAENRESGAITALPLIHETEVIPAAETASHEEASESFKATIGDGRRQQKRPKDGNTANQRDKKLKNLIRDIENQAPKRSRFMKILSPNTPLLRYWVMTLTLLMMYLCTSVPLVLAFGMPGPRSVYFWFILSVDIIAEIAFIFDMFLNFHLGYIDDSGNEVLQPTLVIPKYLHGQFPIDLVVTLPLDMGFTTVGAYFRILKMLRFFPVMSRVSALEVDVGLGWFARLVKLGFPLFIVFHVVGCCWISFSTHGEYGSTIFSPSLVVEAMSYPGQYLYSLFWSLSLLSNTSIPEGSPTNNAETIFSIVGMTVGLGVITYVVGAIGSLMELSDSNRRSHEKRLRDLIKFMAFNEVPQDLQKRVTSYMSYKWTANEGFDPETVLSALPRSLRDDLSQSLASDVIDQVPFFALLNEDALKAVVLALRHVLVMPNEYVYKMGQPSGTMYILRDGQLEAVSHNNRYNYGASDEENVRNVYGVESLDPSEAFGIYESLVLKKYLISVRASAFAELYAITTEAFFAALAPFPAQLKTIQQQIEYNTSYRRKMEVVESITSVQAEQSLPVTDAVPVMTLPIARNSLFVAAGLDPDEIPDSSQSGGTYAAKTPRSRPTHQNIVQHMAIMPEAGNLLKHSKSNLMASPRRIRLRHSLSTQHLHVSLRSVVKSGFGGICLHFRYFLKHGVILPTTVFARTWTAIVLLVNAYNICFVPFRVVFIRHWWEPVYIVCDYVGDAIFLMDIFLNFHMAFFRHGHLVSQVADISFDYIQNRFYRHLLASLPLDLIMFATGPDVLVRIPRLLRAPDLIQFLKSSNVVADPPWKSLTKKIGALVVQYLLLAHFIACAYFIFANVDGYATDINRWLPPTFLDDDTNPLRKYLYGLYFAYDMLLRLGVGINPRTAPQIVFSIVVLLLGVLVVAQLIGSFSSFLQVYDHGESAFKDRMKKLSKHLSKNRIPKAIKRKVLFFFKSQWNDIGSVDMNTVLDVLSDRLREDVLCTIFVPVLQRVSELKKAPPAFLSSLSCNIVFEYYCESSYIFIKGEPADDIYFVRRGRVDVFDKVIKRGKSDEELFDVVLIGRYFGEQCIFANESRRSLFAQAKENTHLVRLNKRYFLDALAKYPDFCETFHAIQRTKSTKVSEGNASDN